MSEYVSLERWLQRIEAKLDKVADDHEERIRKLETRLSTAGGIAAAGGVTGVLSVLNIIFGGGSGVIS